MRSHIAAALGALLVCATSGCGVFEDSKDAAQGMGNAVADAAHDHVKVHLPSVPTPIDLGDIPVDKLQHRLRSIFAAAGEKKENVLIVCKARDLIAENADTTTQEAVRTVLASLNLDRPDEDVARLARITQNAVVASADPHQLGRAAVAWACDWAGD